MRAALNEAIAAKFIRCLREPKSSTAGEPAVSGLYELCWDDSGNYITAPAAFCGFFAGNGNLTYIPNAFFDHTVQEETLSVIKVVGAIIRHTIGFQTKYGMRRQQVQLSFSALQRISKISSRTMLSRALAVALEHNHIVRVCGGTFDSSGGKESEAATYGICWQEQVQSNKQDSIPEQNHGPVGKMYQSEMCTSRKTVPAPVGNVYQDQSEKCTGIEIKDLNKTSKQQQQENAAVLLLLDIGFSGQAACEMADKYPEELIRRQIELLPTRSAARNRLGLLRRAIEEDWPPVDSPGGTDLGSTDSLSSSTKVLSKQEEHATLFAAHVYAAWAGSSAAPTALPSSSDRQSSIVFLKQCSAEDVSDEETISLARDFGRFARSAERTGKALPRSVSLALRSLGDEFFKQREKGQTVQLQPKKPKEGDLDRLRVLRIRIEREKPELFAMFLAQEERDLESLKSNRLCSAQGLAKAVEMFLTEAGQLQRLHQFLVGHRKSHSDKPLANRT